LVSKDKVAKFTKTFAQQIFPDLEKNCISVCNPATDNSDARFRMMNYKLPESCEKVTEKWERILDTVTMANIMSYGDMGCGKEELKPNNTATLLLSGV